MDEQHTYTPRSEIVFTTAGHISLTGSFWHSGDGETCPRCRAHLRFRKRMRAMKAYPTPPE